MNERAQVAQKVREHKKLHPELYCKKCLWKTGGGNCPRHPEALPAFDGVGTAEEDKRLDDWQREQRLIAEAIERFPRLFKLPGSEHILRISQSHSFFSGPTLWLYTEAEINGVWMAYAKGTEDELRRYIREVR